MGRGLHNPWEWRKRELLLTVQNLRQEDYEVEEVGESGSLVYQEMAWANSGYLSTSWRMIKQSSERQAPLFKKKMSSEKQLDMGSVPLSDDLIISISLYDIYYISISVIPQVLSIERRLLPESSVWLSNPYSNWFGKNYSTCNSLACFRVIRRWFFSNNCS